MPCSCVCLNIHHVNNDDAMSLGKDIVNTDARHQTKAQPLPRSSPHYTHTPSLTVTLQKWLIIFLIVIMYDKKYDSMNMKNVALRTILSLTKASSAQILM